MREWFDELEGALGDPLLEPFEPGTSTPTQPDSASPTPLAAR